MNSNRIEFRHPLIAFRPIAYGALAFWLFVAAIVYWWK